jgi:D-tyrosyl-tRNA(Tyr) deacylase
MLSLIQRVTSASVVVDGATVGAIGPGLLALVGIEPGDGETQVARMAQRLLGYRVFGDEQGRMNRSLADTGGGLLLVSQFTLAADTASGGAALVKLGRRPLLVSAARVNWLTSSRPPPVAASDRFILPAPSSNTR